MVLFFVILALVFVVLLVIITNIVIVPQSKVYVIERLGSYSDTWSAGLHVKIPFIERIAKKVSLKEQVADFPPQPVITRDNVTMQIDTVVFFQVMDAKLYTYGVNQPIAAIESLSVVDGKSYRKYSVMLLSIAVVCQIHGKIICDIINCNFFDRHCGTVFVLSALEFDVDCSAHLINQFV